MVEGGVVLIGGDPGIGKSTLCCRRWTRLQRAGKNTLYVTGEESGAQVALRSRRLGLERSQVKVLAEIQLEKILATLDAQRPDVAVIDSIQTVYSDQLTSAPGSVAQVRECARAPHARCQGQRHAPSCWWATSPKRAHWPVRACWSTWSIRCCTSRATPTASSGWCVPSKTASVRSTKLACSP